VRAGEPLHYKYCVVADGRMSRWETVEGTRVVLPQGASLPGTYRTTLL
jgi:hypothetical protein